MLYSLANDRQSMNLVKLLSWIIMIQHLILCWKQWIALLYNKVKLWMKYCCLLPAWVLYKMQCRSSRRKIESHIFINMYMFIQVLTTYFNTIIFWMVILLFFCSKMYKFEMLDSVFWCFAYSISIIENLMLLYVIVV